MAEVVEHPPQARGDRAAGVVVRHDRRSRRRCRAPRARPAKAAGSGSGWRPGPVGPDEVAVDVDEDRAGQVGRLVVAAPLARIGEPPAHVGDAQRRVAEAREQVVGGDQRAVGHRRGVYATVAPTPCYPVARRRDGAPDDRPRPGRPSLRRSSVVERVTVNHLVVGSNPTAGANAPSARKSPSRRTRRGVRFEAYPTSHPTQVPDALRSVWEQYAYRPREKRDAAVPLLSRPPRPGPRATSFQAPRSRRRSDRRRCKPR